MKDSIKEKLSLIRPGIYILVSGDNLYSTFRRGNVYRFFPSPTVQAGEKLYCALVLSVMHLHSLDEPYRICYTMLWRGEIVECEERNLDSLVDSVLR